MRRREFIAFLSGAACLCTRTSFAQPTERARLIGWLFGGVPQLGQTIQTVVTNELRHLGWVEGQNLRIEWRWAAADPHRASTFAKELVELQPDVIVATTTPSLAALVRETKSIPIVFVAVSFPIEQGFVTNLAKPGGNVTGFTQIPALSLSAKWVELLKEIAPAAYRTALMFNPAALGRAESIIAPIETAATSFGFETIRMPIENTDQIEVSVAEFTSQPNSAIIVLPDVFLFIHRDLVIREIAKHRVPAVYPFGYWARAGGLIAYGNESDEPYRLSASYVDRILRGEKPGDLPVQQPTKFELVINLKAAKALGLTVPPSLLGRADEVIE
jgi:putative tryptophan/tyrosine transport system substrate-binding protein